MHRIQLCPYINFQGRAREAMEFYHRVLGGQLELLAAASDGTLSPAGPGDRISQARLEAEGVVILGSDGHPDYPAPVGQHMALALLGSDRARLATAFAGLAEGGRVQMPLTDQPGGGQAGWLADRFGIGWNITALPEPLAMT